MSRATKLRDAVVAELSARLPVECRSVLLPRFNPEDLEDGPILGVRVASRAIEVDMGPDRRDVILMAGLFATIEPSNEFELSRDQRLAHELEQGDALDQIVEDAIDLWSPDGDLAGYLAGHRFQMITQPQTIDADLYYDYGLWASPFLLTYFDCEDE